MKMVAMLSNRDAAASAALTSPASPPPPAPWATIGDAMAACASASSPAIRLHVLKLLSLLLAEGGRPKRRRGGGLPDEVPPQLLQVGSIAQHLTAPPPQQQLLLPVTEGIRKGCRMDGQQQQQQRWLRVIA